MIQVDDHWFNSLDSFSLLQRVQNACSSEMGVKEAFSECRILVR